MELEISTTKENRRKIQDELVGNGTIIDNWTDGSFNYRPDEDCVDGVTDILEKLDIDYRIV